MTLQRWLCSPPRFHLPTIRRAHGDHCTIFQEKPCLAENRGQPRYRALLTDARNGLLPKDCALALDSLVDISPLSSIGVTLTGGGYMMESEHEADRLRDKSDLESTIQQLILTEFPRDRKGMHCADVGCGVGIGAKAMNTILHREGVDATISLFEISASRLRESREFVRVPRSNCRMNHLCCDAAHLPVADDLMDYTFCRFLFEYLPAPQSVMAELVRITRPGGKVVVADLDYNSMTHYPLEQDLQEQLTELFSQLSDRGLLDPFAGRKIYRHFRAVGLSDIRMHGLMHHLYYGHIDRRDMDNWSYKIAAIRRLRREGALSLSFDIDAFSRRFMRFLQSENRFSYTPLLVAKGKKVP